MAGSISEFKSSFRTDVARPNKFDVSIPIPIGMVPYLRTSRNLNLRCESAELPGRSLATTTMKVYGVEEKFPYLTTYNDVSLTFIVGDDMKEKKFFDAWLNWINPQVNFNFKYKNDYSVIVRINQYDVSNKLSYSADLLEAYPIAVNPLSLDWSADGYHKLTVTFAFTQWRDNSLETIGMEFLENTIANSLFGGDTIRTLSNLGKDLVPPEQAAPITESQPSLINYRN